MTLHKSGVADVAVTDATVMAPEMKAMNMSAQVTQVQVQQHYEKDLFDLIFQSHSVHRENFPANVVQKSQLLSIKTGGCPEDCAYCPQSARYNTGLERQRLMSVDEVVEAAAGAKANGATRFCMGAAWREVRDGKEFDRVLQMVSAVNEVGLQTCCTLGMLSKKQAERLKQAGLYAYNHNIDTSKAHYESVISTRRFEDRLQTINHVRQAGMTVCTGGILGMGESDQDRIDFLYELAKINPESVTLNLLVPIAGTPLGETERLSPVVLYRVIACARLLMPKAMIRLSAGRMNLNLSEQFIAFFAGANSIFIGDKLLTSPNVKTDFDTQMFSELGLQPMEMECNP